TDPANLVERLQGEASCPICREHFKDPAVIDCGHSFCQACISQCWEGLETNFSCPQCKETTQQKHLRPNRQLAIVLEIAKELSLQVLKGSGVEKMCAKHQETLKLFCAEDQAPICVVCDRSRIHRAHKVVPIEEAAQEYKIQTETERKKIVSEFEQLQQFLEEQERLLLGQVENLEKEILEEQTDNVTKLSEEIARLSDMITEVEGKCQKPASEFLHVSLSHKYPISQHRDRTTLESWALSLCLHLKMNVILDPDTAHPNLVLSEDQKLVRHGDTQQTLPDNPERFDSCACVLGAEGFTGGRCYWEVEVGDKRKWALGVCRESVSRKGQVKLSPGNGNWAILLRDGEYKACISHLTPLPVSVRPSRVGIFLDYEAGEVSFYNVTDGSHLFTFTDTFSGTLRPYFCPGINAGGTNTAPLIICSVPIQARQNLCP
uniref:Uncharacterized protein n=1 Tax=Pelusios castaneus TaxID=367368 RepID=A0A8C8SQ97_9SAUR